MQDTARKEFINVCTIATVTNKLMRSSTYTENKIGENTLL